MGPAAVMGARTFRWTTGLENGPPTGPTCTTLSSGCTSSSMAGMNLATCFTDLLVWPAPS